MIHPPAIKHALLEKKTIYFDDIPSLTSSMASSRISHDKGNSSAPHATLIFRISSKVIGLLDGFAQRQHLFQAWMSAGHRLPKIVDVGPHVIAQRLAAPPGVPTKSRKDRWKKWKKKSPRKKWVD